MQSYTLYFIWKLLYMFQAVPPPIIRSTNNCIYSIWYLSHCYCYMPSWLWQGKLYRLLCFICLPCIQFVKTRALSVSMYHVSNVYCVYKNMYVYEF